LRPPSGGFFLSFCPIFILNHHLKLNYLAPQPPVFNQKRGFLVFLLHCRK
jgi:hypothetical protein